METEEFCHWGLVEVVAASAEVNKRHQDSRLHAMSFIHNFIFFNLLRLDSQGYLNQSTEMSFIILASQWHLNSV